MTKTMKKVFTLMLTLVLAMSAFALLTFKADQALAYTANADSFIAIVTDFTGDTAGEDNSITEDDLTDAAVQAKLIEAYGYRVKIDKAEYATLPAEIIAEWESINTIAGPALAVYAEMADLYPYLYQGANNVRIAATREGAVVKARLDYRALSPEASDNIFTKQTLFVDSQINYAGGSEKFFEDLLALIEAEKVKVQEAIDAINEVYNGIETAEDVGLSKEDEIVNAKAKIDAVHTADQVLITNLADYQPAEDALTAIKAKAENLANQINAVYATLDETDGQEVYYTKKVDIDLLKDAYDSFDATEYNNLQKYFQDTYPAEYALMNQMLDYCAAVEADIAEVIELINAIGTVTYTTECEAAIIAAETAYDALDNDVKNETYIPNYQTLVDARAEYDRIKAAVDNVVSLIDAIGTVVLTEACEDAIVAAETAYAALADADIDQANVPAEKKAILDAARATFDELKAKVEQWMSEVDALAGDDVNALWQIDLDVIKDLNDRYNAFDANEQAYVAAKKVVLESVEQRTRDIANEVQDRIDALNSITIDNEQKLADLLDLNKDFYDVEEGLHATQQSKFDGTANFLGDRILDKTLLDAKMAKYYAANHFDKAVAAVKADVDAGFYFKQDVILMDTLFVVYNLMDVETRTMVKSYADLQAVEAAYVGKTIVDAEDLDEAKAAEIKQTTDALNQLIEEAHAEIDQLNKELEAAKSSATTATVIGVIGLVIAIAAVVLVFVKKK
ncbi:MAG: hypothetical protein IJW43_03415 [Clostridia bacterium]|nr:hypothetical protein [Clostridia bacterium]